MEAAGGPILQLAASLLQLRGQLACRCPLQDAQGNVLCYNGEVFGGLHIPPGCNDGQVLLEQLSSGVSDGDGGG